MNILLVDDEPQYLLVAGDFLRDEGWNVITAENGEDGLRKLAGASIDIVISDVYMPVMDGLRFHKEVRAIPMHASLPFLFVSANDDPHTLSAVAFSKNDAFLKKGRSPMDIKTWVRYLTSPEAERGNPPLTASGNRPVRVQAHTSLREERTGRR